MKRILLIFLALIFIFSCGKKSQSTQTKISFFGTSAMLNGGPQMNGGIIVVGHRVDDSEKFTIGLQNANDEKTLDLKKGVWEFGAIGWEGSGGLFTGLNQCAYSGIINLDSAETAITFNLDYATCANIPGHGAIVSNPDYLDQTATANQFKTLNLYSCNNLTFPGGVPTCVGAGLTKSFKVIANGSQSGSMGNHSLPNLEGSCENVFNTNLKIPVGNFLNGKHENIMKTSILAYQTLDCSGSPIEFQFNDSMYFGIHDTNLKAGISQIAHITDLYLEHNPTTVSSNLGFNPFGFGKDGDLTLAASISQSSGDYAHIISIGGLLVSGDQITFPAGQGANIDLNDEVMWYVNSETNPGDCADFVPGLYGFAQVTNKAFGPPVVLTLNHTISEYKLNNGSVVSLALPNPITGCSIQIVRVPHYRHMSITASTTYNAVPFVGASQFGGILPLKVSNGLDISGTSTFHFNTAGAGRDFLIPNPACPSEFRCINMGNGSSIAQGGGIVLTWINQINTNGGNSLDFIANGTTTTTGGATGGSGGHIENKIGNINNTAADSFTYDISLGTGPVGNGTIGHTYFQYCQNSPNVLTLNAQVSLQNCSF